MCLSSTSPSTSRPQRRHANSRPQVCCSAGCIARRRLHYSSVYTVTTSGLWCRGRQIVDPALHARTSTRSDCRPLGDLFTRAIGPASRFRAGGRPARRGDLSVLRRTRRPIAGRGLRPARSRQPAESAGLAGAGGAQQISCPRIDEHGADRAWSRCRLLAPAGLGNPRGDRRIAPPFGDHDRVGRRRAGRRAGGLLPAAESSRRQSPGAIWIGLQKRRGGGRGLAGTFAQPIDGDAGRPLASGGDAQRGALAYFERHGRCAWCRLLKEALADGPRGVASVGEFVAFCPPAARFPWETWIVPRGHANHFYEDLGRRKASPNWPNLHAASSTRWSG